MVKKGYDPNSYGLIYYGNRAPSDVYIPVGYDSGLIKYIHNPLSFNSDVETSNPHYNDIPSYKVFVREVSVKGIITNDESNMIERRLVPIKAGPNVENENPYDYAKELEAIEHRPEEEPPKLEPWRLDYVPDIPVYTEINLSDLPDIDYTSSQPISISIADGSSISVPLPYLIDERRPVSDQDKIIIEKITNYSNGFRCKIKFGGQDILADYTEQPRQMAIVDDQQHYMLTDYSQDYQIRNTQAFQIVPEMINDTLQGFGLNVPLDLLDGITNIIDVFLNSALGRVNLNTFNETMNVYWFNSHIQYLLHGAIAVEGDEALDAYWDQYEVEINERFEEEGRYRIDEILSQMGYTQEEKDEVFALIGDDVRSAPDIITEHMEQRELFDDEMAIDLVRILVIISLIQNPESILNVLQDYLLYDARIDDRTRLSDNFGGNVVENMLNKEFNQLITVSYPVADRVRTKSTIIEPRDYAENELHVFPINKTFDSFEDMKDLIEEEYPGELVKVDAEPVIRYGEYTEEFIGIIERGLLTL